MVWPAVVGQLPCCFCYTVVLPLLCLHEIAGFARASVRQACAPMPWCACERLPLSP